MSKFNDPNQTCDIYVSSVPAGITEDQLKGLFKKYGEIRNSFCRYKPDGFGYAIVKFANKTDAENLIQKTSEVYWNDNIMHIKFAHRTGNSHTNESGIADVKQNYASEMNRNSLMMGPPQFSAPDLNYYPAPQPYQNFADDFNHPSNLEVICTTVEDPVTFYGCSMDRFREFQFLIQSLSSLAGACKLQNRKPIPKRVYAALYSGDMKWYRCIVLRNSIPNRHGMCVVRYIDYGNEEETHFVNIIELPEPLQFIPPFAMKFTLANLTCDSKSQKKTFLHQLVDKRMSLYATPIRNSGIPEFHVMNCSCDGKDVINEIVKKGFARYNPSMPKPDGYFHDNIPGKPFVGNGRFPNANIKQKQPIRPKMDNAQFNGHAENMKKEDFRPKKIMKRGSEPALGSKKGAETKGGDNAKDTYLIMVDQCINNLKLINDIRGLVSQSTDDGIITRAIELLKDKIDVESHETTDEKKVDAVDGSLEKYTESLEEIRTCSDKSSLPELKAKRDECRTLLCNNLNEYLGNVNPAIIERRKKIQAAITDLASNTNAWTNLQLSTAPLSVDNLVVEYTKVKDERWNLVCSARENTNNKHKDFMEVMTSFQNKFHLNTTDDHPNETTECLDVPTKPKSLPFSVKLSNSLKDLNNAVSEEVQTLTVNKQKNGLPIVQCLSDKLDLEKEKLDVVCDLYEKRVELHNSLSSIVDLGPTLDALRTTQQNILTLSNELSRLHATSQESTEETTNDDSESESSKLFKSLHAELLQEDSFKEQIAIAANKYFPELKLEYSDLEIEEFSKHNFLLKNNWKIDFFLPLGKSTRNGAITSHLMDQSIVIKEFAFENDEEKADFLQKATLWKEANSVTLIKLHAIFHKDEKTMCVVLPEDCPKLLDSPPLLIPGEGERACQVLRQVLVGLKEIHAKKLAHGAVHPSSILVNEEKIFLDFHFGEVSYEEGTLSKRIHFQAPDSEKNDEHADMFGFGCLVLWVLFPNLSFTATTKGVPNVAGFKSILEQLLLPRDYGFLVNLLSPIPTSRPTASALLNRNFLQQCENFCRTRNDSQKST